MKKSERRHHCRNWNFSSRKEDLRWFGRILQMDDGRLPKQFMQWEMDTAKRRLGRPRKSWIDTYDKI